MAVQRSSQAPGGRISLPLVGRKVEDLLLWRDVPRSGIAFAAATLAYLLLEWSHLSLLTILANSALVLVSVAFLWNNIANLSNRPGLPVPEVIRSGVRESDAKQYAELVAGYLNQGLAFVNRVLHGKDVLLTAQVAFGLYVFGKVGGFFTSLGLLYTVVLLAFTLPKAYELNKPQVDKLLHKGHAQVKTSYSQYVEPYVNKIPRASTSTTSNKPLVPPTDTATSKAPAYNTPAPAYNTSAPAYNNPTSKAPALEEIIPNGGKKTF